MGREGQEQDCMGYVQSGGLALIGREGTDKRSTADQELTRGRRRMGPAADRAGLVEL
jgi:hypothetical protein